VALDVAEDGVEETAEDPGAEAEGDACPACVVSSLATSRPAGNVGLLSAAADGAADAAGSAPDRVPSDPEEDPIRESPSGSVLDEFSSCTPSCVPEKPLAAELVGLAPS
jgi:hypothetical protein